MRIERRKAELGAAGLEEKNRILLEAIAENNVGIWPIAKNIFEDYFCIALMNVFHLLCSYLVLFIFYFDNEWSDWT